MALNLNELSNNLYTFFKNMNGISNSQFANRFSDIINNWYKNASGITVDLGTLSVGAFIGSGSVNSIDSNSTICSSIIENTCNLIDSTKPNNAKTLFAECIANGISSMVNASTINCKVNGEATMGTSVTTFTNEDSEGHITIFPNESPIVISNFEMNYSDYIKLPSNLTPNTINIKYEYDGLEYISSDNGEGIINGEYINGTINYTNGDMLLEFNGDEEYPIEKISISYTFTSNFKGDVLEVLNDLEVQHDENQSEWNTRLGGDADKYFANNLSTIIYTQITSVILNTHGKNNILGVIGIGKLS